MGAIDGLQAAFWHVLRGGRPRMQLRLLRRLLQERRMCKHLQGHEWLFLVAVQGAPVGASLVGESGQRSGRNRLLVDEGERLWRTGGRLQALRRFRHEVQEGQPAAYRGYVPGEQRRQLQGLVRAQREKWQFHLLCSVAAASLFSWERVC